MQKLLNYTNNWLFIIDTETPYYLRKFQTPKLSYENFQNSLNRLFFVKQKVIYMHLIWHIHSSPKNLLNKGLMTVFGFKMKRVKITLFRPVY